MQRKKLLNLNRSKQGDFLKKFLIITGGSSGIGFATAKLFQENNYSIINLSRSKIDLETAPKAWSHDSGVTTDDSKRTCPAPTQGGKCLDCRACWSKDIKSVIYGKH